MSQCSAACALCSKLTRTGSVCGEAVNGYEAITKAVELRPDFIVLDFAMPDLDGLQTADEIGKLLPGVQIVLHTMQGADVVLEANRHGIPRDSKSQVRGFSLGGCGTAEP
jgi:chemotaxis response regulator CheB